MHSRSKLHKRKIQHKSSRKQYNKQSKKNHNSKKSQNNKQKINRKKNNYHTRKNTPKQRGGFNSCSLATVQEPGFTIPAIGDVPGFSLSQSKGAIYRPNCKTDSYQAMTPI